MKILMLCDFFNSTLDYQENLLVKYYRKHGHEVTVVTSITESPFDFVTDKYDTKAPASVTWTDGAKIIRLKYRLNVLSRLRMYTPIAGLLEDERPDLIYFHDIHLHFPEAVRYLKRHPDCRMIMDYHADYANSAANWLSRYVLHGVIRKWALNHARPHLSMIFPVMPSAIVFLREVYGIPDHEMELLPLATDSDVIRQIRDRGEGRSKRAGLGIPDDAIVIFTGGKLTPSKQTELVIEAVVGMPDLPVHLVVVGKASDADKAYGEHLDALSARHKSIHMVGWQATADVFRYLNMADISVFPASQSVLWQHSIGMGLPLIVGDLGGQGLDYLNLHDNMIILRDGERTVDGVSQTIRRLVGDAGLRRRMSEGADKVAATHLDWNILIERTLDFNNQRQNNGCEHV
jgi:1,2-diacylglycerol 3-alpha-glucosyltransferase